jgi:hypothetical protein
MSFQDRFIPRKATTTELYEPYKTGSDWFFDSKYGRRGPFIGEEVCAQRAADVRERDEE